MNVNEIKNNIFQVPIWGCVLKNTQYHSIDYIKYINNLKNTTETVSKSNFGGWQSHSNLDKHGIFLELISTINTISNEILSEYTEEKYNITSLWANINDKYHCNAHHTHDGILSGVFYLQTPENSGKIVFVNPAIRSEDSLLAKRGYPVTPEPLSLIIFPSWLQHYVEPNMSEESRISISFNIGEK